MGDKELSKVMQQMVEQQRLMAEDARKREDRMVEDQQKRDLRMEELADATRVRDEQLARILQALMPPAGAAAPGAAISVPTIVSGALPSFAQFDSTTELWPDYWCRFGTFLDAHSVPVEKQSHVFLTKQSTLIYKMLTNLAAQQTPPKEINKLTMVEIVEFMAEQYHPKRFTVRKRFRFWSKMDRKPGETIPEMGARLRADAATCDFASIKDPQDEALRTRFMCSVNNEAVLKALFRVKDDELTFAKALEIAQESEEAAAVAKETVYGRSKSSVNQIHVSESEEEASDVNIVGRRRWKSPPVDPGVCGRCGGTSHRADACRFKDAVCFHCQKKGHVVAGCFAKKKGLPAVSVDGAVNRITTVKRVAAGSDVSGKWPPYRVNLIRSVSSVGRINRLSPAEFSVMHRGGTPQHTPRRRPGVVGQTGAKSVFQSVVSAQLGGGGASPDGVVSEEEKNHQPPDSLPHQERGSSDVPPPLNSRRPKVKSVAKDSDRSKVNSMSYEEKGSTGEWTSRAVCVKTPVANEDDLLAAKKEPLVEYLSSTSASERELKRQESRRRRNRHNRNRRRELKKVQRFCSQEVADQVDQVATGEVSSVVKERGDGKNADKGSQRYPLAKTSIGHQQPTTETAVIGSRSVSRDDGVGAAVSSTLALEPAELRCQSPATMSERCQFGIEMDGVNGISKGKFAFPSIHWPARLKSDRISSVSVFRAARRIVEDRGCDERASPQTEEVPTSSHLSPIGVDVVPVSSLMPDISFSPATSTTSSEFRSDIPTTDDGQ